MMPLSSHHLDAMQTFGEQLVHRAGEVALKYHGHAKTSLKGPFNPVTQADTEIEEIVRREIASRFAGHQLIGEESAHGDQSTIAEFCWVIDPVDGTVNYAAGLATFCVSLALLHEGRPVLGWVHDPCSAETHFARKGSGAFLNQRRLEINDGETRVQALGISSVFLKWVSETAGVHVLMELIRRYGKLRMFGSQALHLAWVASGRLCVAISSESHLWDDAAGALLVEEAGGKYSDFEGASIFPIVAGSPLIADGVFSNIGASKTIQSDLCGLLNGRGVSSIHA